MYVLPNAPTTCSSKNLFLEVKKAKSLSTRPALVLQYGCYSTIVALQIVSQLHSYPRFIMLTNVAIDLVSVYTSYYV